MKIFISLLLVMLLWQSLFAQKKQNPPPKKQMINVQASVSYYASFSHDTTSMEEPTPGFTIKKIMDEQWTTKGKLSLIGKMEYRDEPESFSIQYRFDPAIGAKPDGYLDVSGGYDGKETQNSEEKWTVPQMGTHTIKGFHTTDNTNCHQAGAVNFEISIDKKTHRATCSMDVSFRGKSYTTGTEIGDNQKTGPDITSLDAAIAWAKALEGTFKEAIHTDNPNWNPVDETPSDAVKSIGASGSTDDKTMKLSITPTGYMISGHFDEKSSNGMKELTSYSIIIGIPEYEVELAPVDELKYKKWLPEGPDMNEKGNEHKGEPIRDIHKGNSMVFHVNVYDGKTHKLVTPVCEIEYKLTQVTKIPGWCGNFPSENPDAGNDMQFFVPLADANKFSSVDELKLKTIKEFGYTDVWVVSYDYAGYAELSATVNIAGKEYPAKAKIDDAAFLKIPYCEGNSKIAEEWKIQNKCQKLMDKDDDDGKDEVKNGKGDHEGDGFTVFEEYRGFCENRKHIRTNPMKKDVMIYDDYTKYVHDSLKGRIEDGIVIFKTATQTDVHYKFKEDEFGQKADVTTEGTSRDKILNFNNETSLNSIDQHGLWIHFNPAKLGYAIAELKNSTGDLGTPHKYKYLDITADFDPGAKGYATTQGTINSNQNVSGGGGKAKVITDEFAVTVAHEMLHCCNVKHHGDGNDFGTWSFASGKVIPGYDPSKIYGAESTDTNSVGQILVHPVNLYDEADPPLQINANDPRFQMWKQYAVGGEHGTCSGVEDCIMRYDNAKAVKKQNGNFYILPNRNGYAELSGIYLCDKADGTGVNATGRLPFPRYGDADGGRGNCKSHFCVNDKYH